MDASRSSPSPSSQRTAADSDVRMDAEDSSENQRFVRATPPLLQTPVRVVRSSSNPRGSFSSHRSPLPPSAPVTPMRLRAQDERLTRVAERVAADVRANTRKAYAFETLPPSGHGPPSSSPSRAEESPARGLSPVALTDAVMSFAQFLYFLEEKQAEYPLMPTIIARFAELGAVIESQKRYIDLWKAKELDLAIDEARDNLELIADLGMRLEKTELKLASAVVEKQSWEEKHHKAVQETKAVTQRAQEQVAQLNASINELRFRKQELDSVVKDRNDTVVAMEKEMQELQRTVNQMDKHGSELTHEHRRLLEQCTRQEQSLRDLQSQVEQLQQQCEAERKRSEEFGNAAHGYEIQHKEEKRLREHLEGELQQMRHEREESSRSVNQLVGESGRYRADYEAMALKHQHEMQATHEKLQAREAEATELLQKLQTESDRVRQMNKEIKIIRKQAEEGLIAVKSDLEQAFVGRIAKLREEMGEETHRVRVENDELQQRCQHLQQLNQKKSSQIAELMSSQQDLMGEGNQRLTDLTSAVAEWQAKYEQLQQEIREREKTSADALRKQGADIQGQYNTHVQEMETYLGRKNAECEQLRAAVKTREDELLKIREEAHVELSKWQSEYQELSARSTSLEFEHGALQRELEHRKKELELRERELETLKQQIEAYLAPDNDRTKQQELLHRERLRLEEQNRHLVKQLEDLKKEAEAKFDEMNTAHLRTAEQESAQRATVVSLHHEKDDMQRALNEISAEKVALEDHLQGMDEEKEVLMESLAQFEKQNGELEDKGKQLLHALNEMEKEKMELVQALEAARTEKVAAEQKLNRLNEEFSDEIQRLQAAPSADQNIQVQVETLSGQLSRREAEIRELQQEAEQYYVASVAAENKCAATKEALDERVTELDRAKRQVEHAQEQMRDATTRIEAFESEAKELRMWNERYQKDLEMLKSQAEDRERTRRSELEARESEAMRRSESQQLQLKMELNQLREWNEKYKKEIQTLQSQAEGREYQRRSEAEARESELMRQGRGLEAEYEKVKSDLTSLQVSAEQEVRRLQTALETQKSEFQMEHQRLVATNERLERQARALGEEISSLKEEMVRVRGQSSEAKANAEFYHKQVQQLKEQAEKATQKNAASTRQAEMLERAMDDFKRQTMRNVQEKKEALEKLEVENSELRVKVAQQTGLKEQALQIAQSEKTSLTNDLLRKEDNLSQARARLRHLEEQVRSLNRELKSREDGTHSVAGHEQRKRIAVELERDELRVQVDKMQEEKESLRQRLSAATDELASLKRQLNETDTVRSDFKHTKTEMSMRLNSLEAELHQTQSALVTERDRIKQLKDALKQARQEAQTEIAEKSQELDSVTSKLQKATVDMERKERLQASRVDDLQSNEANLIKRLKLVQQRCDASASREAELQQELSELVSRTAHEREQLLQELKQTQIVNEVLQGDWSLHEGVRELKNRLVDEQKLVRQHASTIERKESRIRELEARLRKLELSLREQESMTTLAQQTIEDEVQQEMETMSAQLSKLAIENQRLKDHEHREKTSLLEGSRTVKSELQAQCVKLKNEIARLKEENELLREEQHEQLEAHRVALSKLKRKPTDHRECEQQIEQLVAKVEEKEAAYKVLVAKQKPADHRKCQKQIDQLVAELEEKEASYESLHQSHQRQSRSKESTPTSSSSRRVRELERALQEKEKKIMMLNDHLTYLMTSTIELQHENETMLSLQQQPGESAAP